MRFRVLAALSLLCPLPSLLLPGSGVAWAQPSASQGISRANPKDLVGSRPAAPRQPAHQTGLPVADAPPVVSPHGPLQPRKAPRATRPAHVPPQNAPPPAAKPSPGGAGSAGPPPDRAAEASGEAKAAASQKLPDPDKPEGGAAKLPRFVSLRSDDVNMRLGPGTRYRIDWVYKRRDLPVEIEREYDVWRWVRDPDGIRGWVHQATLMGRRSFIVQNADATLRSDQNDAASVVAILKPGVIGRIRSCEAASEWCNVQAGSYRGFLRRQQFWGVLPGEAVAP